jgi:hypothetical protein
MKLNDIVKSMSGYLSDQTVIDFLLISRTFEDTRYSIMRRKAIDKITAVLIAAAKNKELFYDVAKWGEDNAIASKATFSRRKDFLKRLGMIAEENTQTPYGRPKIRMHLNEQKLKEYFGG